MQRSGLSNCLNMPTLVFSKPNATLTNLNDLASLDLNAFATTYGGHPIGYVTSNSATSIWRFTLTIANQCNPTGVTAIAWLRNLNSGCKTGEGDTETSIPDDAVTVDFDWTFYPNPSQDVVNVMWEGDYGKHKKADIRLFDMLGRMVMVPMEIADGAAMLDVSTLQKGNYVLLLHGSGLAPRMLTVK